MIVNQIVHEFFHYHFLITMSNLAEGCMLYKKTELYASPFSLLFGLPCQFFLQVIYEEHYLLPTCNSACTNYNSIFTIFYSNFTFSTYTASEKTLTGDCTWKN